MEKMNMEAFAEKIRERVQDASLMWDNSCNVQLNEITKNNGLVLHGLVIMEESTNISPTIYLENEYENYLSGKDLDACTKTVIEVYQESRMERPISIDFFQDFEQAKERLAMKLVNQEQNQNMLANIPHYTYGDLAVIFQVVVQTTELGNASVTVNDTHMNAWKTTPEVLMKAAMENMTKQPIRIQSMEEVMREMLGEIPEEMDGMLEQADPMMYVMSNETKMNGATVLVCVDKLQEFAEKMDTNLYILPSSIHEILLIPENANMSVEQLTQMVVDVNETQVAPDEVLSNQVYFYDKAQKQLMIAQTQEPMILRGTVKNDAMRDGAKREAGEKKPIKERLDAGKEKVSQKDAEPKETKSQVRRKELQKE